MQVHQVIPDEAVEAAARALWFAGRDGQEWLPGIDPLCDLIVAEARAALVAAAPHMAAQALRDAVEAFPLETITAPDNAVVWLRRRAEQIR